MKPTIVSRLLRAIAAGTLILGSFGCKGNLQSAKTEDEARLMVPVPICVKRLPRASGPGVVVSLSAEEWWSLLLPSYNRSRKTIDPSAPDCSGRRTLAGSSPQGINSVPVDPEKLTLAPGADGMKVVWLQSHAVDDKTHEGLLALTRQLESYMEVYAVGVHRARPEGSRFSLERMGPRLVIGATQEDCSGEGAERRCRATGSVYLMATGGLKAAASYPMEQFASARAPDGGGLWEYRFSASADYRRESISLTEHLSVNAKGQGEIRVADLERNFRLEDGQLIASGESLWTKTLRELGQKPRD
jgi:hypothetical protein